MSDIETFIFVAKARAGARIEEFYPQYKQLNIIDQAPPYTQTDLEQYRVFRDAIRNRCNEYEQQAQAGQVPSLDYSDLTP